MLKAFVLLALFSFTLLSPLAQAQNTPIIGVWSWLQNGQDTSQLIHDLPLLKELGFNHVFAWDGSVDGGVHDQSLQGSSMARLARVAEKIGLFTPLIVWTDHQPKWKFTFQFDQNASFKTWFAGHLQNLASVFGKFKSVDGLIFDSFEPSQIKDVKDFVQFVRDNFRLDRSYWIMFSNIYRTLTDENNVWKTPFLGAITSCYTYEQMFGGSDTFNVGWIGMMAKSRGHGLLGLTVDTFHADWTPDKIAPEIREGVRWGFTAYSYFAWHAAHEWNTLDKHPEWFSAIQTLNSQIQ